jgi:hypothetical protein
MNCGVCSKPIDGEPFSLSDLSDEGNLLKVCKTCAGSQWIAIEYDDVEVTVWRDDYIQCDRERLEEAMGNAIGVLLDEGWELKKVTLKGNASCIRREYDE